MRCGQREACPPARGGGAGAPRRRVESRERGVARPARATAAGGPPPAAARRGGWGRAPGRARRGRGRTAQIRLFIFLKCTQFKGRIARVPWSTQLRVRRRSRVAWAVATRHGVRAPRSAGRRSAQQGERPDTANAPPILRTTP